MRIISCHSKVIHEVDSNGMVGRIRSPLKRVHPITQTIEIDAAGVLVRYIWLDWLIPDITFLWRFYLHSNPKVGR